MTTETPSAPLDGFDANKILATIREDIESLKWALEPGGEPERDQALERVLAWVPKLQASKPFDRT